MSKKRDNSIGYRPSEEVKKVFDEVCIGEESATRQQVIEIAMRFLISQGDEKRRNILSDFLVPDPTSKDHLKKGEHRKRA